MTGQPDFFCDLETDVLEEVLRRAYAAVLTRRRAAGAGSSIGTASAGDNVVPHPALHFLQPGHFDAGQAPAAPESTQEVQAAAAPRHGYGLQPPPAPQFNHSDQSTTAPHAREGAEVAHAIEWAALERLVKEAIVRAEQNRSYYDTGARRAKKMSGRLRFGAIIFGLLGGLCQLLPDSVFGTLFTNAALVGEGSFFTFAEIAKGASRSGTSLVFFLLSGAWLLIDKVFAYTSSVMRFRLIELKLGKLIRTFALEVECEQVKYGGKILPADRADSILANLKAFVARVEDINIEDTETWIAELKAGLQQIEQFGRGSGKSVSGQK